MLTLTEQQNFPSSRQHEKGDLYPSDKLFAQ